MDRQVIVSTSASSANCTDILLRETPTTRLVFRPQLVDNPHERAAAVRGTFIYQRKSPKGGWESTEPISLSTLKKDEGYKLELAAGELLALMRELVPLYRLYAKLGIPFGLTELVPVDSAVASLAVLPADQVRTYLSANEAVGEQLLSTLLEWVAGLPEPASLVPRLLSLGPAALRNLNVAVGLGRLKQALGTWEQHATEPSEEFWQQTLTEHAFVLEQVFAWPTIIVKGKAYVGGKTLLNTGGNLVDFLVKNALTGNTALIEIKTPATKLLGGRPYRDAIYTASEDLNGAVMQVLNYRFSLQNEFKSLAAALPDRLEAFDPRCVVVVGMTKEIQADDTKRRSFELFRGHSQGVMIVTFDEVFEKTRRLISLLETTA